MHADLDLLCVSVYVTADDLLPGRPANARRKLTDAEIVTLCVAQVLMGIPSDRRFLRAARRQLGHHLGRAHEVLGAFGEPLDLHVGGEHLPDGGEVRSAQFVGEGSHKVGEGGDLE